ncbi:MAG: hypothetical protein IH877_09200, partial [Gemmatimonadetes bacterium]|nr:hypothetical protein [Gemmatimonadota bacterium]
DINEDFNRNGTLDANVNEDINGNGIFEPERGEDLNGDGTTDSVDAEIEDTLLGLWTQQLDGGSWAAVGAEHSSSGDLFHASIYHFTNYAVGW